MTSNKIKWFAAMVARYGSEEAVRLEMKRRQQKSMLNPNRQKGVHKGGFSYMSPEERRLVSQKGGRMGKR